MSYTSEVKSELSNIKNNQCCQKAELSALLHIGGSVELRNTGLVLVFQTTNNAVIRKFMKLVKDRYHVELTLISKKQLNLQKNDLFIVQLEENVEMIMKELSLMNKQALFFQDVNAELIHKECCKRAYLRGAFLAGGSINSPETATYHLEIQTTSDRQAEVLKNLAEEFQLNAKIAKNKRGYIMYIKEAEKISDFLRATGATNQLFEFEDSRIKRDFKNSINRVINCDIANERKALDAAKHQLDQIEIVEKLLVGKLPKSVFEVVELRKMYPDSTLNELSYAALEHYGYLISKSALNHRFRALKEIANSLVAKEEYDD
jgi:cell division protein WhiA